MTKVRRRNLIKTRRVRKPSKRLWREASRVAKRFDAKVTALSSQPSVGSMGDERAFGPAVLVEVTADMFPENWGDITSAITSEVDGPNRVLIEVKPS